MKVVDPEAMSDISVTLCNEALFFVYVVQSNRCEKRLLGKRNAWRLKCRLRSQPFSFYIYFVGQLNDVISLSVESNNVDLAEFSLAV